jgi:hypothetical protein
MPLARQPATAGNAGATTSHHGHLCRYDLILKGRHELLRLGQPKPKVSCVSLLIALDAGNLGLRHFTRPQLRHQSHPPHQLRHQANPLPVSPEPTPTTSTPPTILNALIFASIPEVRVPPSTDVTQPRQYYDPVRNPSEPPFCNDVEAATLAHDGPPPITRLTLPTCRAHYPDGPERVRTRILRRGGDLGARLAASREGDTLPAMNRPVLHRALAGPAEILPPDSTTAVAAVLAVLSPSGEAALAAAQDLARRAAAPATLRAYKADWTHFSQWCAGHGIVPVPAAPAIVGAYLASLAGSHAPTTIHRRL